MLISLKEINKKYIDKVLLDDVSFSVEEQDKIGIMGVNGTGKSTLLKIIMGESEQDSGTIYYKRDLKISYMPQNPKINPHHTIFLATKSILKDTNDYEIKSVLNKMGLNDIDAFCGKLSGGELRRLSLAITLLKPADLLILDEPTNHLDIWMIKWLEEYLIKSNKAILLVTHDRYFLERVTKKILEIELGKVYIYEGNYSAYLEAKEQRLQFLANNERRLESIIRKEKKWVEMNPQARSTKSKERLERYSKLNEELIELSQIINTNNEVMISSMKARIGEKTIIIENLEKSFNDKILFKNVNYIVSRFDRLGIVGANGCGKTTLLNIILGRIFPDNGKVTIGETVKIGYFHQQMEVLPEKLTPYEYVRKHGEYLDTVNGQISASELLENYLFTPSMQHLPIALLSGGEKRRLQLLGVLISNPNILILDEPTNDLDIYTLARLEDFLEKFSGAVIVVSHDRYFLDKVINHLFYFKDQTVFEYMGIVSDFFNNYKKEKISKEKEIKKQVVTSIPRFTSKEKKEFDKIEEEIELLEEKIKMVKSEMNEISTDYLLLLENQKCLDELNDELINKMERWEYLSSLNEKIEMYRKGK